MRKCSKSLCVLTIGIQGTDIKMGSNSVIMNTSLGPHQLVQELNDKMADLMVPALVYIVVLMVTGAIGNVMVCFYYGYKTKLTTNSFFIVVLAIYDLIVCLICMPTEIADVELYYTFENDSACKALRLLNYFAGIGSILTLVAIAVDRYRRIRKPTQKQMSLKIAKIVSCVIVVVAAILSFPSAILYGSIQVDVPNDLDRNLTGFDCTSTKEKAYRPIVWAFNGTHFVMFFLCTVVLVVMYAIIGAAVCKHRKRMAKYSRSKTKQDSSELAVSMANTSHDELVREQDGDDNASVGAVKKKAETHERESKYTRNSSMKDKQNKQMERRKSEKQDIGPEAIKVTMVMVTITTLFILSFLPYLSLTVWRVKEGQHEAQFLSGGGLVGFKIGSRSFLLNSAFNPWVYGIFNSKFRKYFFNFPCCKK